MIALRDVSKSDERIYAAWQNDSKLGGYLSRLSPTNGSVGNYDVSRVCWFIIEQDGCDIGSVWLEKDRTEPDTTVLGIFITEEQYRGAGSGSYAINEAIRISKQRMAFGKVRLNVRKSNLRAIQCYEKCGFRICGEGLKNTSDGTVIDFYQMEMKVEKEGFIMRTEKEMFDMILNVVNNDERIRAVYMNGSRANPKVIKDTYQDYDIVFMVTETKSFLEDKDWITVFGEPAIIQEPNREEPERYYTWLMLFKDGNRIDLHIRTKEYALEEYVADSLTVPLLDKDNCLPEIPTANDSDYYIKRPEESRFRSCCNNFWWCLQNVAKGIARDQLPYAMWMYNSVVRDELAKMIGWHIGINIDFSVTVGMSGKYYKKYLPEPLYSLYTKTYSDSDYNNLWAAIFNACKLFRIIAPPVGKHFGFTYNQDEDTNMMEYLNWVKASCKNRIDSFNQNSDELWKASKIKLACFDLDHTLIYGVHSVLKELED